MRLALLGKKLCRRLNDLIADLIKARRFTLAGLFLAS